jgi:hypothetical protein
VGEGEDPKAAFSDAIKRAAVDFGVGRALYAMRAPWLRAGDAEGELRRNRRGRLMLDERREEWCRERYRGWLEERGRRLFGQELEHGDEAGAPGSRPRPEARTESQARPRSGRTRGRR